MLNSEDVTSSTCEEFTPRVVNVEHIKETEFFQGNALNDELGERVNNLMDKNVTKFNCKNYTEEICTNIDDPDVKVEYSVTTLFVDPHKEPPTEPKTESGFGVDPQGSANHAMQPCVVVLEKLPAILVETSEKYGQVSKAEWESLVTNRNKVITRTSPKATKDRSYLLCEELSEGQKKALVDRAIESRSFLIPARELSHKWGVLISEQATKNVWEEYLSNLPLEQVSKELLSLKSVKLLSIDSLTSAEKLEMVYRCKNMDGYRAAQFAYDTFGKFVSCMTTVAILYNSNNKLNLPVKDRTAIIDMAAKKGIVHTARFFSQKWNMDVSECLVKDLCKITGTTNKCVDIKSQSMLSPDVRQAIGMDTKIHSICETACRFSVQLGTPISEKFVRKCRNEYIDKA